MDLPFVFVVVAEERSGPEILSGVIACGRRQSTFRWRLRKVTKTAIGVAETLARAKPAGIILCAAGGAEWVKPVLRQRRPVVICSPEVGSHRVPTVVLDHRAIGRMGGEHLLSLGLRHVAYVGPELGGRPSRDRLDGCHAAATAAGATFSFAMDAVGQLPVWGRIMSGRLLPNWLRKQPRPIGILAFNDQIGFRVMEVAQELGYNVPHEVAVLGVDNSPLVCDASEPTLSSIDANLQRVGFLAAETMVGMLEGRAPAQMIQRVPPLTVVSRTSTNTLHHSSPHVTQALRFIYENARNGIGIVDVARHMGLSLTSLERLFKREHTELPGAAIRHARLDLARQLLQTTTLSLVEIGMQCGYDYPSHLSRAFKTHFGHPPTIYRQNQSSGDPSEI